jgi:hypothetical protein
LGSKSYSISYARTTEEGEVRYKAWGEERYITPGSSLLTKYQFTGQRNETGSLR